MYNTLSDGDVARLFELFSEKKHEFIKHVINTLPDLIYVMNLQSYKVIYCSRALAREIGYSNEEAEQMKNPILEMMHPQDVDRFLQHLELLKHSKPMEVIAIEYRLIRHDGSIAWFIDRNAVFTRSHDNIPETKVGITHEITARKEHEEKIAGQEGIMHQTEILTETGSWQYDGSTAAFTWSEGMYRLFHLSQTAPITPAVYQQYSVVEDSAIADKVVADIESQTAFEEVLRIRVDGTVRNIKIRAAPVKSQFGDQNIIGVDLDITDTMHQQQQLQELNDDLKDKNNHIRSLHLDLQTLTQLTSSDYKESLRNIYTMLELFVIQDAAKMSNSGKANVRRMQSLVQRLNLMTDDVLSYLDISRERIILEDFLLSECLEEVIEIMRERLRNANAKLQLNVTGTIRTDKNLFFQLMQHLLSNAIKFHESGSLLITVSSDYVTIEDATFIALEMRDNGPGFDLEDPEQIFNLFFKRKEPNNKKGPGVGLAIARKIMELHHGMIHAAGAPEDGARFICYFPV